MQQLYQLSCYWTDSCCMLLHQGTNLAVNSIDVVTNVAQLRTIKNIEIHAHSIVIIPTRKKTGMCTLRTPCIYEVQINEIMVVQNTQLYIFKL